jgi:hypothetical protein
VIGTYHAERHVPAIPLRSMSVPSAEQPPEDDEVLRRYLAEVSSIPPCHGKTSSDLADPSPPATSRPANS